MSQQYRDTINLRENNAYLAHMTIALATSQKPARLECVKVLYLSDGSLWTVDMYQHK